MTSTKLFFAQTNVHDVISNSFPPFPPPLSYPKKVVYLPLLHHTCSLKLNTGKVIQPYLQPFLPTGYEGL